MDYFPRQIDQQLLRWSSERERKPLVLRGARQTGKSSSVRELGRHFELYLELNLDRREDASLVRACRSSEELLLALRARHRLDRFPDRTLLFIDEIQENAEAVGWLRYFHEDHPALAVVAAGSLLEVRIEERGFSFPVGRVTFRTLRPMSFFEVLRAQGDHVLADELLSALASGRGAPPVLHEQAMAALRAYCWVGGMPEAVSRWVRTRSAGAVRQVHSDLLQAFAEDIQKYRRAAAAADLQLAFDHLRHHFGQRFRYENFVPGHSSPRMRAALDALEGAMILHRAWPTTSLAPPFVTRPKAAPKLFPLDVGLAAHWLGADFEAVRTTPIDRLYDGRLAEMFVAQQVLTRVESATEHLHFWVSESSRASAETDLLLAVRGRAVPVEVKAGAAGSLKSLHQFLRRSGTRLGVRYHGGPFADEHLSVAMPDGRLEYRLLSVPLYVAERGLEPWVPL